MIAAAVCLSDDAIAALAASLTATAHATRVTTAPTRALAHHP